MKEKMWWVNTESEQILNRGYLLTGESVEGAIDRITTAASNRLNRPDLKDRFKDLIERGWMSLSSPIWANMGTERGLPISCFNVDVPDGIEEITHKLGEVIMQTKIGGGTSGYFGNLRARGSAVTNNGESSGAVSFMKLFDTAMDTISQGGVRRGAFATYLDIDHPDIEEFLNIRNVGNPIQNLFYGVCIPDYWLVEMEEGDENKRRIWAKVLESRQQKGMPYLFFSDNVNGHKPQVYKDLNMRINASNLCVHGDTKITTLSDKGVKDLTIQEVSGTSQTVWNGESWSLAKVEKTGEDQKLYKVKVKLISSREVKETFLDCTDYHKWYNHRKEELRTLDLVPGMVLESYMDPKTDTVVTPEVEEIVLLEGTHDTYCLNEPIRHKTLFNGILTGQCSEIALPSSEHESFICCLSSMNLELYDEWKDTDAVHLAIYFLDAVMSEFIEKTKDNYYLKNAHNFGKRHRSLGLGVLGYHSYLQKNMIPFDSWDARSFNVKVFKQLKEQSYEASIQLGVEYGVAPIFNEVKTSDIPRRNTTTMAIAPTTSSSAILGQVSPGIEPFSSNYYKAGLAKGNFIRKNTYLAELLKSKSLDTEEVWRSIMLNSGSVQHLDGLTAEEKEVFKTFKEINQQEIINQASSRQRFIDQSQSLNINIPSGIPIKDVNRLYLNAHKAGVKTLYYQRSQSVSKEMITGLVDCSSCES